jgi:hypothetical protein
MIYRASRRLTPVLASLLVCGRVQVFVDSDGYIVEFGEEARRGFSLTSNYALDVLAAIAYFTRQSGDAILPNLPAQVFDSNNSCLHSCRHFWPQVEIFFGRERRRSRIFRRGMGRSAALHLWRSCRSCSTSATASASFSL